MQRIAVTDLAGRVLAEKELELAIDQGPAPVLDTVSEIAQGLLAEADLPVEKLIGIGAGLPGPVEFATGKPTSPPIMPGWDGFDVPAHLRRTFDVPILVDNRRQTPWCWANTTWCTRTRSTWCSSKPPPASAPASSVMASCSTAPREQPAIWAMWPCLTATRPHAPVGIWAVWRLLPLVLRSSPGCATRGSTSPVRPKWWSWCAQPIPQPCKPFARPDDRSGPVLARVVNLLNPSVIVIGGLVSTAGEHFWPASGNRSTPAPCRWRRHTCASWELGPAVGPGAGRLRDGHHPHALRRARQRDAGRIRSELMLAR